MQNSEILSHERAGFIVCEFFFTLHLAFVSNVPINVTQYSLIVMLSKAFIHFPQFFPF